MIRTTTDLVTFRHAFTMLGIEGSLPAGQYSITRDEELIEALSFLAWRRLSTTITVKRGSMTQVYAIDQEELDALLNGDAAPASGN